MRRGRRPQAAGGRRARGRPRRLRGGGAGGDRGRAADRDPARRGAGAAGRVRRPGDRRDRPPHLARARRVDPRARPARTRSPSSTRSRRSSIATRSTSRSPGSSRATTRPGPGGGGADYINCPLDRGAVRGLRRRAARRRRRTSFKDWEASTPYFEGCLPIEVMAERGPGDAALRADEAGRPDRSAHRPAALCGRPAAPGQRARHAVQHGRLPDQAHPWRAEARSSARSPGSSRRSSRASAACTATPSSTARACSMASCA